MKPKFDAHVKKNIIEIERDQYIHPNDPLYIVKLMRYNNKSAHFHYKLGQEHEKEGRYSRALFHYIEAIRVHSPDYYKAKSSLLKLEKQLSEKPSLAILDSSENLPLPVSSSNKKIMYMLAISNLGFIVLLLMIAISEW